MIVLFSILIVIVLIFYAFSLIIKKIFDRRIKRLQQQVENQQKEDEAKGPHIDPNIGEYTDFEEVE